MLRNTLRQCARKLQSSPRASLSTLSASPSRAALQTCRRPLALAQRRSNANAAEDTNKGVVSAMAVGASKFSAAVLTMTA
jgi:2-oxoglutarate dehydrogenase E1 component